MSTCKHRKTLRRNWCINGKPGGGVEGREGKRYFANDYIFPILKVAISHRRVRRKNFQRYTIESQGGQSMAYLMILTDDIYGSYFPFVLATLRSRATYPRLHTLRGRRNFRETDDGDDDGGRAR